MQLKKSRTCTRCRALDKAGNCNLGYRVKIKTSDIGFKLESIEHSGVIILSEPQEKCPKPVTEEVYQEYRRALCND